ncbi:MAG: hypothetical protein ABL933_06305 [Methyloglobulus sp.]|nr:hypothetical protein [Methyloglobulus sp.]
MDFKKACHLGMDCRDPEARDGNVKNVVTAIGKIRFIVFHILVIWIPAVHAGMTTLQSLKTYISSRLYKSYPFNLSTI